MQALCRNYESSHRVATWAGSPITREAMRGVEGVPLLRGEGGPLGVDRGVITAHLPTSVLYSGHICDLDHAPHSACLRAVIWITANVLKSTYPPVHDRPFVTPSPYLPIQVVDPIW